MAIRGALVQLSASIIAVLLLTASPAAAGPTLLFDAGNGKVLYAEEIDDQWHPASLTKIMTAYLTFEALKAGKLRLDTKMAYSAHAAEQPPSKIGLEVGSEISVELALKALVIKSANDIAVALAEAVGGTEKAFVERMNAKARQLGMTRTHFVNANGLPAPAQVTTARDLARLSRAVVRDFPQYAYFWSLTEMQVGRARIETHNNVLKTFEGADGLKTGFICDSGYNVVVSAVRDGTRLMAVVLGGSTGAERDVRAVALLTHGYSMLGWKTFFMSDTIDNLPYEKSAVSVAALRASDHVKQCTERRKRAAIAASRRKAREKAKAAKTKVAAEKATKQKATKSAKSAKSAKSTKVAKSAKSQ
jgi:D-alanyl-D-alanine carboxypeptidase